MTGISIEDIAPASGTAWKPEVGDKVQGTIVYAGEQTRESTYTGKMERSLRIDLDTGDETVSVYATSNTDINGDGYAKRDAKAIAAAVRASGSTRLELGGTLAMKRTADFPTERGPAKTFVAEYKPPTTPPPAAADAADDGAVSGLID